MKSILIICFSNLNNDPRILRQVRWAKDIYDVTTLGYSPTGIDGIAHIDYVPYYNSKLTVKAERMINFFGRNFEKYYWNDALLNLSEQLKTTKFDVIVANDIDTLPLAVKLGQGKSKVVFDAHEYAPLEWEDDFKWRMLKKPLVQYICREYIPKVSAATTVCQGIADLYEQEFDKKFEVITNASDYREFKPSKIDPNKIKLIYHGNASQSRQTDKQIDLLEHLDDRFALNLMLTGDKEYIGYLKTKAGKFNNVNFLAPTEFSKIVSTINQFDIGYYSLAPTNINNKLALPNKFFEFIQARLAIAISPSVEMARITNNYDLGVVSPDFEIQSIAKLINSLTAEKIEYFKANCNKFAYELSAEKNGEKFLELLEN